LKRSGIEFADGTKHATTDYFLKKFSKAGIGDLIPQIKKFLARKG
jgi:hypothetical protein